MRAEETLRRLRALPEAPGLDAILGGAPPLVLAPHADDESLGCGGLLAASVEAGLHPAIAVLTDGTGSHPNSRAFPPARLRALREGETLAAAACLGVAPERVAFLGFRDTQAPRAGREFDRAVAAVVEALRHFGCGILLAPWRHDPHGDHEAAHRIAAVAAREAMVPHLAYPVWGWLRAPQDELAGPEPAGWRLAMGEHLPAKRRAIAAHASQYGGLITDDPAGFTLPAALLAQFAVPFETFLTAP